MRGQEDDRKVAVALLQLRKEHEAVGVRKLIVQQDRVDAFAGALERLAPCAGLDHPQAVRRQPLAERPAHELLVVDDEDGWGLRHPLIIRVRGQGAGLGRAGAGHQDRTQGCPNPDS
jgi:hypothetical protein